MTKQQLISLYLRASGANAAAEIAGCSITVCALDEPMLALWDAPVRTAALTWG